MPWWGYLIAGSVAAFCATVLTTARMVVRALVADPPPSTRP